MATDNQLFDSEVTLDITTPGDCDLILGMPWLRRHSGWVGAAGPSLLLMSPQSALPPSHTFSNPSLCSSAALTKTVSVLNTSPSVTLPSHLDQFSDIFLPRSLDSIPPHQLGYNCKITLKSDSLPPYSNPYRLSKY